MLSASAEVIAARTALMVQGLTDPRGQDMVELSLMTSEKTEALAASAAALAEGARALGAAAAVACARTPAEAVEAQFRYALGWWSRAAGQTLTLTAELAQAQTAALAPIHKTAVANAKRLRKS